MNSKKTYKPVQSGIIWPKNINGIEKEGIDVDLEPGQVMEPGELGFPVGFHPDTHEVMYMEESKPELKLPALPKAPQVGE